MKGSGNVEYIRQGSEVAYVSEPNWGFLTEASTTKHRTYNVGDRVVTPDGRVFRYCVAGPGAAGTAGELAIDPQFGVCNPDRSTTNAVAPAQVAPNDPHVLGVKRSSGQVGDICVTITVAATDGPSILTPGTGTGLIAKDALRGGYIVINNGANQDPQFFGVIGNDAVAAGGGSMNVFLDAPIRTIYISNVAYTGVVVGTTNIELYLPPYGNVRSMYIVNSAYVTCLGFATTRVLYGQYFWVQTWGPSWATSNNTTGEAANGRDLYVATDGSLRGQSTTTYAGTQRVGTGLDQSASNRSNGPLMMIQIAI